MSTTELTTNPTELDVIGKFVANYKRDSRQWHEYMDHTLEYLDKVVKEDKIASIVAGRVKKPMKVEEKLRKKQSFYQYGCEKHILNNMVDFVGLRVSAYFPNDQKKILRLIDKRFITIASVYFKDDEEKYILSKGVTDAAGKEIIAYITARHNEAIARLPKATITAKEASLEDEISNIIASYVNQRYLATSQPQASSTTNEISPPNFLNDNVGKEFVAQIKQRYKTASTELARKSSAATKRTRKTLDNYQRRFGGYTAEHRWVILRPAQRDANVPLHVQPVEIQIRSVLMDSWIAINRDIEYDALTGILSAPERRILDSIKGLAQTGEVLLEQLHHVHHQRLKQDQISFKRPEDLSTVFEDYFNLEDPVPNYSKDPFADALLSVLRVMDIQTPGELKMKLNRDRVKPDCQQDFATFRTQFPVEGAFDSYVLPHILKTVQQSHIKSLWGKSDLLEASFLTLLEKTLAWIGLMGQRGQNSVKVRETNVKFRPTLDRLPLTCGYHYITLLFCISVWCREDIISAEIEKHSLHALLIKTFFECHDLPEEPTPFTAIALVDILTSPQDAYVPETSQWANAAWAVMQLIARPLDWEHGVSLFFQYMKEVTSKLEKEEHFGPNLAENMQRASDQVSTSMFHWVAKRSAVHEIYRLVYTTSYKDKDLPHTRNIWDRLSNHTLLDDFHDLVVTGDDFLPWKDIQKWSGSTYAIVRPDMFAYCKEPVKLKHTVDSLTLYILDCKGMPSEQVERRLKNATGTMHIPGKDIIILKNITHELMYKDYASGYWCGTLELDNPDLHLATWIKWTHFHPSRATESPGSLGPLWKVISPSEDTYALVCDLLIKPAFGLPPARLRLPNCKPGTMIASKFLPSEDTWDIRRDDNETDGDEISSPYDVLVKGLRDNSEANGKSYALKITLRPTEQG